MSINLQKGQKVDLTKTNPSVVKYAVGLGWDANSNVGSDFDLDASAFILGTDKKRLSDKHFVFYGNLQSPNGSVVHSGDNLTGAGDGDDETLNIDFSKLEAEADEIVFVVTVYLQPWMIFLTGFLFYGLTFLVEPVLQKCMPNPQEGTAEAELWYYK